MTQGKKGASAVNDGSYRSGVTRKKSGQTKKELMKKNGAPLIRRAKKKPQHGEGGDASKLFQGERIKRNRCATGFSKQQEKWKRGRTSTGTQEETG